MATPPPVRAYEELDVQASPVGELVLRRRRVPGGPREPLYEITLDGDLLMSSWLDASERALARATLARVACDAQEVLVGGLGLGRTLEAALDAPGVRRVTVVELSPHVIRWMRDGLVPWGASLCASDRVEIVQGDFFATMAGAAPLARPARGFDAILVDIDHAPDELLGGAHAAFYRPDALRDAAAWLAPGGAFGFWSAGEAQGPFLDLLRGAFRDVRLERVAVFNPMIDEEQVDTIYVATDPAGA